MLTRVTGLLCLAILSFPDTCALAQVSSPQVSPTVGVDKIMQSVLQLTADQRAQLRAAEVPFKAEKQFGNLLFAAFQLQLKQQKISFSNRNLEAKYVAQLVERLQPKMSNGSRYQRIQVYIVDSPEIDARSIPGGTLLFFRGLLEFAESEAALVGIIGHELSHLDRRHQLKPLQQQQLFMQQLDNSASTQGFDLNRFFDFGKMSLGSYHPIHPEEEAEADEDAVRWMHALGYDPAELAKLFGRLAQRGQGQVAGQAELVPAFLRTHPLMRDRSLTVLQLTEELQRLEPNGNLVVGSDSLKNRRPADLNR